MGIFNLGYENNSLNPADAQMKQMQDAAKKISTAFETGMEKGSTAQEEEKFLGVIELPPGVSTAFMTAWTTGITTYSNHISDFLFKYAHLAGEKAFNIDVTDTTQELRAKNLRTGATIAANSFLLLGSAMPTITKFFDTQKEQHKKTVDAAKRLAPVLNEIKGRDGLGAFASIKATENEVIYAHRRRINDKAGMDYGNHAISLVAQIPILGKQLLSGGKFQTLKEAADYKDLSKSIDALKQVKNDAQAVKNGLIKETSKLRVSLKAEGKSEEDIVKAIRELTSEAESDLALATTNLSEAQASFEEVTKGLRVQKSEPGKMPNIFGPTEVITAGLTPLLGAFQNQNKKRFDEKTPAYTGLEMILTLERQVCDNPNVSAYDLPKGGKNSSRNSLPLKEYVAEILRHHQLDMEAIDSEYTPIRKALDPQLMEIAEPIAKAIKDGEISALSLVRLVGEGHIIKNKGRSLCSASEVKVMLEKMTGNSTAYTHLDPKEYFADAAFNKKELKEALDALSGEEKLNFACLFPDSVLLEEGMSEAEVKDMRAATMKMYETNLGQLIVGMASEDDQRLHDTGLAKEEIKEIRAIAEKIKTQGTDAVADVRSKPNNPIGIERTLASAAVGQILAGDIHYLGKLTSQAVEMKAQPVHAEAAEGAEKSHASKVASTKKHGAEHAEHAGHAAKESHRREGGSEHHEVSA